MRRERLHLSERDTLLLHFVLELALRLLLFYSVYMHTIRSELKIENQNKTILLFYVQVTMQHLFTNRLPYERQKPPQQQTIQSYLPASLLV